MSNTSLTIFTFENNKLRSGVNDAGEPLFVASDVCEPLGLGDTSKAVSRLDDDEKGTLSIRTPGGEQQVLAVTEPGLYKLIGSSRKPEAKAFKRWIYHDVLPSIRKTGSYVGKPLTPAESLLASVQQLVDHERQLAVHEDRIARLEAETASITDGVDFFTVKGYCKYKHLPSPTEADARSAGKRAAKLSRERGYPIDKAPDSTWGEIGRYHRDVLAIVFGGD